MYITKNWILEEIREIVYNDDSIQPSNDIYLPGLSDDLCINAMLCAIAAIDKNYTVEEGHVNILRILRSHNIQISNYYKTISERAECFKDSRNMFDVKYARFANKLCQQLDNYIKMVSVQMESKGATNELKSTLQLRINELKS